jgi:PAS domain S-box-containing protein
MSLPSCKPLTNEFTGFRKPRLGGIEKRTATIIDVEVVSHELDFQGTEAEVVTSHDVSERKRAERTTNLLAAIVDSSEDAIISKGLDGTISSWNKAAERLFGHTAEETIGRHISLIIPADRPMKKHGFLGNSSEANRIEHFETVRVRKDGTLIDICLTISPVRDASGRIIGASKAGAEYHRKQAS